MDIGIPLGSQHCMQHRAAMLLRYWASAQLHRQLTVQPRPSLLHMSNVRAMMHKLNQFERFSAYIGRFSKSSPSKVATPSAVSQALCADKSFELHLFTQSTVAH